MADSNIGKKYSCKTLQNNKHFLKKIAPYNSELIAELEETADTISQCDILKEINVISMNKAPEILKEINACNVISMISMNSSIHLDLNWTNEKIDQENAPCLMKQDEKNVMNAPGINLPDECDTFYDAEDAMLCSDTDLIR